MFFGILIFDPNFDDFAKAIFLANFDIYDAKGFAYDGQNRLISPIFGVFSSAFLHRTTLNHF